MSEAIYNNCMGLYGNLAHGPFGWRRIRPMIFFRTLKNEWTHALPYLYCNEKSFIQSRSQGFSLPISTEKPWERDSLLTLNCFWWDMVYMTYWGPIEGWLPEGSVVKFRNIENRVFKQNYENFSRLCRQKSLVLSESFLYGLQKQTFCVVSTLRESTT